jgi:hypothetical protein
MKWMAGSIKLKSRHFGFRHFTQKSFNNCEQTQESVMNHKTISNILSKAVAVCIGLGCLPAYAQNFDAPGNHTFYLDFTSNSGVKQPTLNDLLPKTVKGVPDLLYGRDFLIGNPSKPEFSTTSPNKVGYIPLAVSGSVSNCGSGSCTASAAFNTGSCTTEQSTFGITATIDIPLVSGISIGKSTNYSYQACASTSSSASTTFKSGQLPAGTKGYAIEAIGYSNAAVKSTSRKVYWSPSIRSDANYSNQTLWTKVFTACSNLGWSYQSGANWTTIRAQVRQTGYCYLASNKVIKGFTIGAQPFERVSVFPIVPQTATRVVGEFYPSSNY